MQGISQRPATFDTFSQHLQGTKKAKRPPSREASTVMLSLLGEAKAEYAKNCEEKLISSSCHHLLISELSEVEESIELVEET